MSEQPEDSSVSLVMPPREAARQIGVSVSTLRRLATIYESVHGPLPWEGEDNGGGRLWTDEAVKRVAAAKALVAEGRSKSVDNALRALEGGLEVPASGRVAHPEPDIAAVLASIVQPLVNEIAALRGEVAELKEVQRQLELPTQAGVERVQQQGEAGEVDQSQAAPPVNQEGPERSPGGVLVQVAERLERAWGRLRGQ